MLHVVKEDIKVGARIASAVRGVVTAEFIGPCSLEAGVSRTHTQLFWAAVMLEPELTFEELWDSLAHPIEQSSMDGKWWHETMKREGTDWGYINCIAVSLAYLFEAERALKAGQREVAWEALAEARFFCGHANASTKHLYVGITKFRQAGATGGFQTSQKKYGPLIGEALRFVKETAPDGGWHSRMDAARRAAKHIEKYAFDWGIEGLQSRDDHETVDRWLRRYMSDQPALFEGPKPDPVSPILDLIKPGDVPGSLKKPSQDV